MHVSLDGQHPQIDGLAEVFVGHHVHWRLVFTHVRILRLEQLIRYSSAARLDKVQIVRDTGVLGLVGAPPTTTTDLFGACAAARGAEAAVDVAARRRLDDGHDQRVGAPVQILLVGDVVGLFQVGRAHVDVLGRTGRVQTGRHARPVLPQQHQHDQHHDGGDQQTEQRDQPVGGARGAAHHRLHLHLQHCLGQAGHVGQLVADRLAQQLDALRHGEHLRGQVRRLGRLKQTRDDEN